MRGAERAVALFERVVGRPDGQIDDLYHPSNIEPNVFICLLLAILVRRHLP